MRARLSPPRSLRSLSAALSLIAATAPWSAFAERVPTAVLWVGGAGGPEAAAQADAALTSSATLAPIADAEAKRLLVEGGPVTRVRERMAAGRERFAALRELPQADAMLAEAEAIALGEVPVGEACPHLVEIARLRMRFAELTSDGARAARAATLLRACLRSPTPDDAAALSRHAPPPATPAAPLRVESDPPGATVFLDLAPVGVTPIDLPSPRRAGAMLDVERQGSRKAHRTLDDKAAGTLSLALGRDDGLAALVDRVRDGSEARPADVAELARRLGATQVVALRGGREGYLDARLFDVGRGAWVKPAAELRGAAPGAPLDATGLLAYLAPVTAPAPGTAAAPTGPAATPAPGSAAAPAAPEAPVPAWKRWYTWVVGGALVVGVGAYVLAGQIGDDQITVHVER